LSIQPGLCSSNDLRIRWEMATFQLFFQSGGAKDLSTPLLNTTVTSLALRHLRRSRMWLLSHWTACVRYLLLTVSSFISLSVQNPSYRTTSDSWIYVDTSDITFGCEPPVTDASEPNKQIFQNVWLQLRLWSTGRDFACLILTVHCI
jgi:hypothetical protein